MSRDLDSGITAEELEAAHAEACEAPKPPKKATNKSTAKKAEPKKVSETDA